MGCRRRGRLRVPLLGGCPAARRSRVLGAGQPLPEGFRGVVRHGAAERTLAPFEPMRRAASPHPRGLRGGEAGELPGAG
eukprot:15480221-Alexandrium_andersonii.AAC.1